MFEIFFSGYLYRIYCRYLFVIILLMFLPVLLSGQQIDQIGKKGGIRSSGGISINQVYKDPINHGEMPYSFVATGSLNTSMYGLSIPMSFTYSNSNWTYSLPFNQFSISPSYKWITLHLGYGSMSFSPYSLSGHTYAGVGVELKPEGNFHFAAMYGRLRKATPGDSIVGLEPQYNRYGTGMSLSYIMDKGEVGVNVFYAKDDLNPPDDNMYSMGITPHENLILGTDFKWTFFNNLRLLTCINSSMMSTDRRLSSVSDKNGLATKRHMAAKSNLDYSMRLGTVGVGIEYVEPGYNSLGSFYMVNDFINYTVNAATSILKGKVTLAASTGVRMNNLKGDKEDEQYDYINSLAVGFTPSDRVSFNASYSNFLNYTFIRPLIDEINTHTSYEMMDTLSFTQINESISLSVMYKLKENEVSRHILSGNLGFQEATQKQSDVPDNAGSVFVNGSGGYQLALLKADFNSGANVNYSRSSADSIVSHAYGPMVFFRKSVMDKKVQLNLSLSYNETFQNQRSVGSSFTTRTGANYTLKKKHMFSLNGIFTDRKSQHRNSSAVTVMFGYSFRFDLPKQQSNEGL